MILTKGDIGDDVALLQRRLTRAGYPVPETHVFDHETESAVMTLQRDRGLVIDGIAGPKTLLALPAERNPLHLCDDDLVKAAGTLGISVAAIRAVNEVESRGQGFLTDGRPVILFERHVFYKRLSLHGIDPAPIATRNPNIVSTATGGYQGGAAEYVHLAAASLIHADAAHESASWGAFQIMGYHWETLGYSGIADFVACMQTSEAHHLDAFVRFIAADTGLLSALKGRKWAAFAKGYNGPNYAHNLYDVKLARAYEKYAGREEAAA